MKNMTLAAVLVCSLGIIAPAQANNASFGFGVQTPVMTDNRAQPWLADQKTMKSNKTSASKTNQSPFLNSLQYKMKTWIKKINRDSSNTTADSSN